MSQYTRRWKCFCLSNGLPVDDGNASTRADYMAWVHRMWHEFLPETTFSSRTKNQHDQFDDWLEKQLQLGKIANALEALKPSHNSQSNAIAALITEFDHPRPEWMYPEVCEVLINRLRQLTHV